MILIFLTFSGLGNIQVGTSVNTGCPKERHLFGFAENLIKQTKDIYAIFSCESWHPYTEILKLAIIKYVKIWKYSYSNLYLSSISEDNFDSLKSLPPGLCIQVLLMDVSFHEKQTSFESTICLLRYQTKPRGKISFYS